MSGGASGHGAKWKTSRILLEIPYRAEYLTDQLLQRDFALAMLTVKKKHRENVGNPKAKLVKYMVPHIKHFELGEEVDLGELES